MARIRRIRDKILPGSWRPQDAGGRYYYAAVGDFTSGQGEILASAAPMQNCVTARLRLGVEPSDHWLVYVTGGLPYGEVDTNLTVSDTVTTGAGTTTTTASASGDTTRAGWTIGAGTEWVITGA